MAANANIRITAEDRTRRAVTQAQRNFRSLQQDVFKVSGAVATASAALSAFTLTQAQAMKEQVKFAKQLGITTQSLTELAYAFGQEGNINAEQFTDTMQELNVRLGEAAATGGGPLVEAFAQLGLSISEVRSLKTDEMVLKIADAFYNLEDAQRATFLSEEIFAGEAAKLVPLLNKGSIGVKNLTNEYRDLAGVITEDEAQKLSEVAVAFDKVIISLEALGTKISVFLSEYGTPLLNWTNQLLIDLRNLPGNLKKAFELKAAGSSIDAYNKKISNLIEEIQMIKSGKVTTGVKSQDEEWIQRNREIIAGYNELISKASTFRNKVLGPANVEITKGSMDSKSGVEINKKTIQEAMFNAELEAAQMHADAINEIWDSQQQENEERARQWSQTWDNAFNVFSSGVGDAFASALIDQSSLGDALQATMRNVAKEAISSIIRIGLQRAIQSKISKGVMTAQTAAGVAQAGILASAYAPAALVASIATFGGAALAAASAAPVAASAQLAAMASTKISGVAHDGLDYVPKTGTYLLEKGERVVKKEDNEKGMMGNTYNFTIQAIDTQNGVDFIMKNESAIARLIQSRYDSSGRMGGPLR